MRCVELLAPSFSAVPQRRLAMASAGAAWLAKHGEGTIVQEERETLRKDLLKELLPQEPCDGLSTKKELIEKEVDRFLDNGRASEGNFTRLARRAKLIGEGATQDTATQPASARNAPATPAGMPQARPPSSGPQSAREPSRLNQPPPEGGVVGTGAYTWSQVARYGVRMEQQAEQQRRQKKQDAQREMRAFLDQQIAEKRATKSQAKDEDQKMLEFQVAELERFRASENQDVENRRMLAMEVRSSRLEQVEAQKAKRKQEREAKLEDDKRLISLANTELELEKKFAQEKKKSQQTAMAKLADAWVKEKALHAEDKKKQMAEERKQLKDYQEMLDRAEARKREEMKRMVARVEEAKKQADVPTGAQVRAKAKQQESHADAKLAEQVLEASIKAAKAELRKEEEQRQKVKNNRDFLSDQIQEQRRNRAADAEQKKRQKLEALSANLAYIEGEKNRIEQCRMKNIQHKVELEQQIEFRRMQPKVSEDVMSSVEMAFNKKLVTSAAQDVTPRPAPKPAQILEATDSAEA